MVDVQRESAAACPDPVRCCVIGAGSWGTAIARHLAMRGHDVRLWSHGQAVADGVNEAHRNPRYLSDVDLPETITASCDLAWCLEGARAVAYVVPSKNLREIARLSAPFLAPDAACAVLTKGIEPGTCELMTQVVADEVGGAERVACLCGPNFAAEVARGVPSAAVVASQERDVALRLQSVFHAPRFRTYVSEDPVGVETCAASKNVMAIACGIARGVGGGDNTAAMLMTRGLAEMGRLVAATGGDPVTCMGLAGMGDLVATCTSTHSRNYTFGLGFAGGESVEAYMERTHMVVEGYYACASISQLAERAGVELPIVRSVYRLLYEGATLDDVIDDLFARAPRDEFYGFGAPRA